MRNPLRDCDMATFGWAMSHGGFDRVWPPPRTILLAKARHTSASKLPRKKTPTREVGVFNDVGSPAGHSGEMTRQMHYHVSLPAAQSSGRDQREGEQIAQRKNPAR